MSLPSDGKILIDRDDADGYLSVRFENNIFPRLLFFVFPRQEEVRVHMTLSSLPIRHVDVLIRPEKRVLYLYGNFTGNNGRTTNISRQLKFEELLEMLEEQSYGWVIRNIDLFDYKGCLSKFY